MFVATTADFEIALPRFLNICTTEKFKYIFIEENFGL